MEEREKFLSYIEHVYPFYGYGYWTVELAGHVPGGGTVIGRCGLQDFDAASCGDPRTDGAAAHARAPLAEEAEHLFVLKKEAGRKGTDPPFSLELGYAVAEDFRRRGYAFEMCQAVLAYAFETLGADEVFARIRSGNAPSLALARKLGFGPCGLSTYPSFCVMIPALQNGKEYFR